MLAGKVHWIMSLYPSSALINLLIILLQVKPLQVFFETVSLFTILLSPLYPKVQLFVCLYSCQWACNPRGGTSISGSRGGGGGLDLTSSLEAKFGVRSGQVHQIRGNVWEVLLPQDAKVGKKSQFWGHI